MNVLNILNVLNVLNVLDIRNILNVLNVLNAPLISSALVKRRYLFKNIKLVTFRIPIFSLFLHPTDSLLQIK